MRQIACFVSAKRDKKQDEYGNYKTKQNKREDNKNQFKDKKGKPGFVCIKDKKQGSNRQKEG